MSPYQYPTPPTAPSLDRWARDYGLETINHATFGERLARHKGIDKKRHAQGYVYVGLGLRAGD